MELCLLEGFWPSPATLATIGHVLQGQTPLQWRASFPTASSKLGEWVERVESIVTYLPSLLNTRELQVMSLSRLANPSRFILALLLETGGNPDGLSLRVEMVDKSKELEQLHAGCYSRGQIKCYMSFILFSYFCIHFLSPNPKYFLHIFGPFLGETFVT